MKGGWRWNAGRPARYCKTTSALRLDVRALARDRALIPGSSGIVRWPNGASISFMTAADQITVSYQWTRANQSEPITCQIDLERTECHFGGCRPWFLCPDCGARGAVVYVRRLPSCRTCSRLVYPSQAEDFTARSWRRTQKINRRLGLADDSWWKIQRPKGMRQATFDKLSAAYWQEEAAREQAMEAFMVTHGWLLR